MIDPELKASLTEINKNLVKISGSGGKWNSFFNGALSGFGYIIGVLIALAALGWILNVVGVIPALKQQVSQWQQILEQSQTFKSNTINSLNQTK